MRDCSRCGLPKPDNDFQKYKGHPIGQCRTCRTAAQFALNRKRGIRLRKRSVIVAGKKLCLHCGDMKLLSQFSNSLRGLGGKSSYCKPCINGRPKDRPKAVRATRTYREKHRAKHLARHRVRMFEYRSFKHVTSDGTVTEKFLNGLYATVQCYYCQKDTREDLRTADHKVSLSKGGAHSAANLVMACWECNCSKQDLSSEEFLLKLNR